MKVILHIGWHKTGTSSIQDFLIENKEWLLKKHGIYIPNTGLLKNAHHKLAWSLQNPLKSAWAKKISFNEPASEIFDLTLNEAKLKNASNLLLSSEEFSLITHYKLEDLANNLAGTEVEIISYVRRQDKYLESLYNQLLKNSFMRYNLDFDKFINQKTESGELDYYLYFEKWCQYFPEKSMTIRPYDRSYFEEGDVRKDFLTQIGIYDYSGFSFGNIESNESLSRDSAEFLIRMNKIPLGDQVHERIIAGLKKYDSEILKYKNNSLLKPEQRIKIMEQFSTSNELFSTHFLKQTNPFVLNENELKNEISEYQLEDFLKTLKIVLPEILKNKN